jgi:uncharacterized protein YbjT (DUF2867 family)
MRIALTGATGFIGSHVLTELQGHGHEVTALVRNGAQAEALAARGATATVVDLYDRPAVAKVLGDMDGAVHTASPGDATRRSSMQPSMPSQEAASHTSTSAACGSTVPTPLSARIRH